MFAQNSIIPFVIVNINILYLLYIFIYHFTCDKVLSLNLYLITLIEFKKKTFLQTFIFRFLISKKIFVGLYNIMK